MLKKTCCCFTSILLSLCVIVGGVIGGGIYAYATFAEPYTNVSFKEIYELVKGIYKVDEELIVTNPYNKVMDLENFYKNFKAKAFISESTDISVSQILKDYINNKSDENGNQENADNEPNDGSNIENAESNINSTGNTFLDAYLESVNFDFSVLRGYNGGEYLLEISDKEMASVFNEVISISSSFLSSDQTYGIDIDRVFEIKQVIINSGDEVQNTEDVKITANLCIDIKELVNQAWASISKTNATTDILCAVVTSNMVSRLLPKKVYINLEMYPNSKDKLPKIHFNNYSESQKVNLYKLINGVMGGNFDTVLMNLQETFVNSINSINEIVPINFVDSSLSFKPINAMLSALKVDSALVSDVDFLYMIKHIKFFDEANLSNTNWVDLDADLFFESLKAKYFLKSDFELNLLNFTDSLKNIEDNIEIDKAHLANKDYNLLMDYKALAGILQSEIDKNEKLGKLKIKINRVECEMVANQPILNIVLAIDVKEMLKEQLKNSVIANKLINELFDRKIYIEAVIDINKDEMSTELKINSQDIEVSDNIFSTISNLSSGIGANLGDTLNPDVLKDAIDKEIKKAINGIENNETGLGATLNLNENGIALPTVYSVVNKKYDLQMQDEEIREVLYETFNTPTIANSFIDEYVSDTTKQLITQFETKYFINEKVLTPENIYADFKNLVKDIKSKTNKEKAFDINSNDSELALKGLLSASEIAILIIKSGEIEKLSTNIEIVSAVQLYSSEFIKENEKVYLNLVCMATFDRNTDNPNDKFSKFMPETVFFNIKINMQDFSVSFSINSMDDVHMKNFEKMTLKFKNDNSFSLAKIMTDMQTNFANALNPILGKNENGESIEGHPIESNFTELGIQMSGIFEVLRNILYKNEPSAEKIPNSDIFKDTLRNLMNPTVYENEYVVNSGKTPLGSLSFTELLITDKNIAHIAQENIKSLKESINNLDIVVEQVILLNSAVLNDASKKVAQKFGLGENFGKKMIVTMSANYALDEENKDIMPSSTFITMILNLVKNQNGEFEKVAMFNNLSQESCNIVTDIFNLNKAKGENDIVLEDIADKTVNYLMGLGVPGIMGAQLVLGDLIAITDVISSKNINDGYGSFYKKLR